MDKYLKEILQDVISNLTSSAWRVRESRYSQAHRCPRGPETPLRPDPSGVSTSQLLQKLDGYADLWSLPPSCLALNDLVRGRQADDLIDYLAEMWETLFRVLDDIKVQECD